VALRPHDAPAQFLPASDRLTVDGNDHVAGAHVGRRSHARRRRIGEHRALPGNARDVRTGEEQRSEQQIGDRTGRHDRHPPPHRLAIERARHVGRRDRSLALVGHFHVAAERNRRQRPFRLVAAPTTCPQHAPEADGKAQHLDARETGDDVMAEFVEHDEHAERDGERDDLVERVDHGRGTRRWARGTRG
jgi:hypothetical protein